MATVRVLRPFASSVLGWSLAAWTLFTCCCVGWSYKLVAEGADPEFTRADAVVTGICSLLYFAGGIPAVMAIQRHPGTRTVGIAWALLVLLAELASTVVYATTHADRAGLVAQLCCFPVPILVLAILWLGPTEEVEA